jgi:hypothetical protein
MPPMEHSERPSWRDAELAGLLAEYFGEKLSPPQLERLASDVGAAIVDRRKRADTPHKGEHSHAEQP